MVSFITYEGENIGVHSFIPGLRNITGIYRFRHDDDTYFDTLIENR